MFLLSEASPAVTIAISPNSPRRTRSARPNWKLKTGGSTKKSRRRALTSVAATAALKPRNRETRKMAARNGLPTIGSNQCWASSSTTRAMPGAMMIHANVRTRHIPDLSMQRPCQRTKGIQAAALGVQAGLGAGPVGTAGPRACPGALECAGPHRSEDASDVPDPGDPGVSPEGHRAHYPRSEPREGNGRAGGAERPAVGRSRVTAEWSNYSANL